MGTAVREFMYHQQLAQYMKPIDKSEYVSIYGYSTVHVSAKLNKGGHLPQLKSTLIIVHHQTNLVRS